MIDASINPAIEHIALRLKTIPESPGVYQHLDAGGTVIYVGKARNLQRRVSSYFSHYDEKSPKIKMLVRSVRDIRVTVVATEVDALLLENSLIKRYQPRYNSMLKDDKSYPYLCITDEPYPRLLYTRRHTDKGQYFGPYPNGRILRELQDIIRQLFQYRTCDTMGRRACMKHQIGLCGAPCTGQQSQADYRATFDQIRRILRGDFGEILDDLKKRMYSLAAELRFEEAEQTKRKIHLLEEYQSRSTVVDANVRDVDVVSIAADDDYAYLNFMRCKNGAIIYSISNEVRKQLDESDAEILATAIPALHEQTQSTAAEVIVPLPVPDLPEAYLRQNTDPRGDRRKLLELSLRNVESYRKQCRHQRALTQGDAAPAALRLLERAQKALGLPRPPMEIECFDNSNIQGAYPVAGMVRFSAGKPNRKEYRKFNIKTVEGPDDYASMAEVIGRRYRRLRDEGLPLPDLLIVDGGEGQMHVARQVIAGQLHLDIPIAGLAKDDRHRTNELLRFDNQGQIAVVGLKPTDPLFHLLEQIQNEVHRFAITFHKDKRSKGTFRTSLTDIPGIGQKTAHDLLLRFGSVKQVALQTLDDLAQTVGAAKARLVYDALHAENS
ncbi:MAG: excinuclease ABC subunit C [Bacteroidales bacterium]|nr:excinuclease ABC subunit C [Bacteroidales bacterium]